MACSETHGKRCDLPRLGGIYSHVVNSAAGKSKRKKQFRNAEQCDTITQALMPEVVLVNLVIAGFWFALGLALIFVPRFDAWRIRGTDLSIGWFAIVLAGYNLLRWWLWKRGQRPRHVHDDDEPPSAPQEYHPEFDFSDRDKPKP
jgi:hypothetical protein